MSKHFLIAAAVFWIAAGIIDLLGGDTGPALAIMGGMSWLVAIATGKR